MSEDRDFVALGPVSTGFRTHGTRITTGGEFVGTLAGVVGRVQSAADGSGVLGFSSPTGQQAAGIVGTAMSPDGNGVIADAHGGPLAYAIWARSQSGLAAKLDGNVHIQGHLTVTGTKSSLVTTADGTAKLLYAIESPESWFEDFGIGRLVDGYAKISLDGTFASAISGDVYHVFVSEYEENTSLYVAGRSPSGFEVRSKTPGSGSEFSYRVVAKRGDIPAARFAEISIQEKEVKHFTPDEYGASGDA
ncbi:hypothetical protein [Streptomyces sp. NPDC058463]|uniref:hypothetical protein n=1 Tax=Streptomyces sp. NPDC058463 TaxID=3346510 RepID=UPI00365065A4